MKVALASDHAGFALKQHIAEFVKTLDCEVVDLGTNDGTTAVDYPDFAERIGLALLENKAERGILICGSGVGASVAANKVPGIRAGLCHDTYSAHQGVEHDAMNVLVLGGRVIGIALAQELVTAYLNANYTSEERHQRRLNKVAALEHKFKQ